MVATAAEVYGDGAARAVLSAATVAACQGVPPAAHCYMRCM